MDVFIVIVYLVYLVDGSGNLSGISQKLGVSAKKKAVVSTRWEYPSQDTYISTFASETVDYENCGKSTVEATVKSQYGISHTRADTDNECFCIFHTVLRLMHSGSAFCVRCKAKICWGSMIWKFSAKFSHKLLPFVFGFIPPHIYSSWEKEHSIDVILMPDVMLPP